MAFKMIRFVVLAMVFSLVVVWQIPGTIALRNILICVLFVLSLAIFAGGDRFFDRVCALKNPPLIFMLLLTGWFILACSWAVEPDLSIREIVGQWLMPLMCGITATLLVTAMVDRSEKSTNCLIQIVFWALFSQVLLHDIIDMIYWLRTGIIPFRQAPILYLTDIAQALWSGGSFEAQFTGNSGDKFSYVNNALATIVIAEILQRVITHKRWLPVSWPTLVLSCAAVFMASFFLQFRNGNVGLLLLICFSFLGLVARLANRLSFLRLATIALVFILLLSMVGTVLFKSDSRWAKLKDSSILAWNADTSQHLRESEMYTAFPSGYDVDISAYARLSWAKEGVELISDNLLLGTGYNRNAFGDGLDRKYNTHGTMRGGHSHSGLIDFTIANGLVGLLLWLSFLGSLFWVGWKAFARGNLAQGLSLMLIVSGFFTRSIVDSNIRDHMLQQFLFMSMLFACSCIATNAANRDA